MTPTEEEQGRQQAGGRVREQEREINDPIGARYPREGSLRKKRRGTLKPGRLISLKSARQDAGTATREGIRRKAGCRGESFWPRIYKVIAKKEREAREGASEFGGGGPAMRREEYLVTAERAL